jgi:hypothetical protein
MLAHELNREPEAPTQNSRNQTVWLQKSDPPVLSDPMANRGTASTGKGILPPTKSGIGPEGEQGL